MWQLWSQENKVIGNYTDGMKRSLTKTMKPLYIRSNVKLVSHVIKDWKNYKVCKIYELEFYAAMIKTCK